MEKQNFDYLDLSLTDVLQNYSSYFGEVEDNFEKQGKRVSWETYFDILLDFGDFPVEMSGAQIEGLCEKLSKKYCGLSV